MSRLAWYWHRLRAMSPAEMLLHARKKLRQAADAKRTSWPEVDLACSGAFPKLPRPEDAPQVLRDALRRDAEDILAGRWRFFGHLELQVDDPPKWQCDYLVRRDMETTESAFKLNYRTLPDGVDSKLIWEPSRWYQLVRLAMAAYVLGDRRAGEKCVEWLEDWVKHNPPYRGWNWTSALEVGMRLIQFAWMDALLGECRFPNSDSRDSAPFEQRMIDLRRAILPSHVWYAWRHKSFGSSANNHLLGELAGCIVAIVRWPGLAHLARPIKELAAVWRVQVYAQFSEDGGNKEQALSYQLFAWEFCWQTHKALEAATLLSGPVEQRLAFAARFFWEVQARTDHWDYGDSDNGMVVPFIARWEQSAGEWHHWFESPVHSPALSYWLGEPPTLSPPIKRGHPLQSLELGEWWLFSESRVAVAESGYWWLRWDLSPLGFLRTAAHGHLDALHLSIWFKGVALIVDPGTGAYFADKRLRNWLASRNAHNAPCPENLDYPQRLGPFLWSEHHRVPEFLESGKVAVASLPLPKGKLVRTVRRTPGGDGWKVADAYDTSGFNTSRSFSVRWQFAPGSWVKRVSDRKFSVHRADVAVMIEVDENWAEVELVEPVVPGEQYFHALAPSESLEGIVSPAFRKLCRAPFLKLTARPQGDKPCVFSTTFLASAYA